jgi:hypothetical protein
VGSKGNGWQVMGTHIIRDLGHVLVGMRNKGNGWQAASLISTCSKGDGKQVASVHHKGDGWQVTGTGSMGNGWQCYKPNYCIWDMCTNAQYKDQVRARYIETNVCARL